MKADILDLTMERSHSIVFRKPNARHSESFIERTLYIDENVVRLKLHPTRRYLENQIEDEGVFCYNEDRNLQKEELAQMRFQIHEEGKYRKIEKAYQIFDERVEAEGILNSCVDSCSNCCHDLFYISENEFFYLVVYFLQQGNRKFLRKAYRNAKRQAAFLKENEPYVAKLAECNLKPSIKDFYNAGESFVLIEPCPFLTETGKCGCYPARPNICRAYGTTGTCSNLGNKERSDLNRSLLQNGILQNGKAGYIRQYRPIYYFILKYFRKMNYHTLLNHIKAFVEEPETEYLRTRVDEELFLLNEKGW